MNDPFSERMGDGAGRGSGIFLNTISQARDERIPRKGDFQGLSMDQLELICRQLSACRSRLPRKLRQRSLFC
jgi:hypothetical protein